MDVAVALVGPGIVGGLLVAAVLALLNRRPSSGAIRRSTLQPISPDLINMAHIPIAGVGGLGMVATGVAIAICVPEIGWSLLAGAGLGAAFAVGLIVYRSRSDAAHPGGHDGLPPSVLTLNDSPQPTRERADRGLPGDPAAAAA